jgi:hypothetical protein
MNNQSTLVENDMQTMIITDMMQTTVKFQPNGLPIDPEDGHRRAFLAERNQKRANARSKVWRTHKAKLAQILAGLHLNNHTQKEIT